MLTFTAKTGQVFDIDFPEAFREGIISQLPSGFEMDVVDILMAVNRTEPLTFYYGNYYPMDSLHIEKLNVSSVRNRS